MNKRNLLLAVILTIVYFSISQSKASESDVVYGNDDRKDIGDSKAKIYRKLGRSTMAMINRNKVIYEFGGLMISLKGVDLATNMSLCKDVKFADHPTFSSCSGFLISPKHVLTAGHCIREEFDCSTKMWMFDYRRELALSSEKTYFDANNIYGCSKIISRDYNTTTKMDFALIELDREVLDREPLKYRTEGKMKDNSSIFVIGHPSGLPTIVADNAIVRSNNEDIFFSTNLDSFGGNSGSAVFNSETGLVEGILVRGETDYRYDPEKDCSVPFQCKEDGCRGEEVTRITGIEALLDL